jgi:hypothetical protein
MGLATGYYQRGIVRSGGGLLVLLPGTPVYEIGGVKGDHTDDGAIERGNNPALPELLAEEDSAQHGQNAGEIIESNHVEHS